MKLPGGLTGGCDAHGETTNDGVALFDPPILVRRTLHQRLDNEVFELYGRHFLPPSSPLRVFGYPGSLGNPGLTKMAALVQNGVGRHWMIAAG